MFVAAWWNLYQDVPCYISDIDEDLMTFYTVVRDSPAQLIELIKGELDHWRDDYRAMIKYLDTKSAYISVAAKVYLYSRLCFGSLQDPTGFAQSKVGDINGTIANVDKRINWLSGILNAGNITLANQCVFEVLDGPMPYSFIYLDPPYAGAERVYKRDAETFDHQRLFHTLDRLDMNVGWILSHRDDAYIRGLYDGYFVMELDHTYQFKPDHQPMPPRPVTELLISNMVITPTQSQLVLDI